MCVYTGAGGIKSHHPAGSAGSRHIVPLFRLRYSLTVGTGLLPRVLG